MDIKAAADVDAIKAAAELKTKISAAMAGPEMRLQGSRLRQIGLAEIDHVLTIGEVDAKISAAAYPLSTNQRIELKSALSRAGLMTG